MPGMPGIPVHATAEGEFCDDCHTVAAWTPVRFNHDNVTKPCFACHDNYTATGKQVDHILASEQCETCHNDYSWFIVRFDHSTITAQCYTCHNNVFSTGQSAGHFVTNIDCDECHNSGSWLLMRYAHMSANYPGDHTGSNPQCNDCHANSSSVIWADSRFIPDCAACHVSDFMGSNQHRNDDVNLFVDCESSCHRPPLHRVNDAGF
jgi:hypothetical protein